MGRSGFVFVIEDKQNGFVFVSALYLTNLNTYLKLGCYPIRSLFLAVVPVFRTGQTDSGFERISGIVLILFILVFQGIGVAVFTLICVFVGSLYINNYISQLITFLGSDDNRTGFCLCTDFRLIFNIGTTAFHGDHITVYTFRGIYLEGDLFRHIVHFGVDRNFQSAAFFYRFRKSDSKNCRACLLDVGYSDIQIIHDDFFLVCGINQFRVDIVYLNFVPYGTFRGIV